MEAVESAFDGLSGVVDGVMKEIRAKFQEASQHAGIWESLQNFIAAVDWTVWMGLAIHNCARDSILLLIKPVPPLCRSLGSSGCSQSRPCCSSRSSSSESIRTTTLSSWLWQVGLLHCAP